MSDEFERAFSEAGLIPNVPARPSPVPVNGSASRPPPAVGVVPGILQQVEDREVALMLKALSRQEQEVGIEMDLGNPFSEYEVDLSSAVVRGIESRGFGLLYRKEGSNPQGRLTVSIAGQVTDLAPGMMIRGAFRDLTVVRSNRSAQVGKAKLIVFQTPHALLSEPAEQVGELLQPVNLLGNVQAGTFVAVAENTQPSGVNPTGSFDVTGWRKIRLYLDGGAANTLTSTDLIPWQQPYPTGGTWFEQGEAARTVSDSRATGYRYRSLVWDVGGRGLMFFEIRSALPAGLTEIGMAVEGIE